MTHPDAIDQSYGFADPDEAKRRGIKAVMMYLSWTPGKNATAAKILAYHKRGIGVWLGWEAMAGGALGGAAQGQKDATEAVRQFNDLIRQVGYAPKNKAVIDFAVDFDTNPSQYPKLDAYLTATAAVVRPAGFLNGVYAEADYVEHTAGRGITDQEFQTYAWSGGDVADVADVLQFLNTQTLGGASVDFDTIRHPKAAGIWWPPNHPNNRPDQEDDEMSMSKDVKDYLDAKFAEVEKNVTTTVIAHVDELFSHGHDGDPDQIASIVRQELHAVGLRAKP